MELRTAMHKTFAALLSLGAWIGMSAPATAYAEVPAHSEATGSATAGAVGHPPHYLSAFSAFRLVPRLTLFGVSQALATTGVVLVPIAPKTSFVLGDGAMLPPSYGPFGSSVVHAQARAGRPRYSAGDIF